MKTLLIFLMFSSPAVWAAEAVVLECVEDDGLHDPQGIPANTNVILPKMPCKEGEILYPKSAKKPHEHKWEKSDYAVEHQEEIPLSEFGIFSSTGTHPGWVKVRVEKCSCGLFRLPPKEKSK